MITEITDSWKLSVDVKNSIIEREANICSNCMANFRQRSHADAVLKLLNMTKANRLMKRLGDDGNFAVYETASYSIFRMKSARKLGNYTVSEYFDKSPFGSYVHGVRNENLEALTFPDKVFDVVINSDVLEHVADLDSALSEIKRVLKPGGFHVFTIPVDPELPATVERARVVDGNIEHIWEPVMHGDTIRGEGILAFRDFGSDVLAYTSRECFDCKELKYYVNGKFVTSVYYAQKMY
jgi:SAM-dependent methyltransferase